MKKVSVVLLLSFLVGSAQALDKRDLEVAIRSLDIASVRQVVEENSFTVREQRCYLDLAEEVVRSRELWILRQYTWNDVTTPYEGPSRERLVLEWAGASFGLVFGLLGLTMYDEPSKADYITTALGATLLVKFIVDYRNMAKAFWEQQYLLRKKYEDAVTIKQLIYAAQVVEG